MRRSTITPLLSNVPNPPPQCFQEVRFWVNEIETSKGVRLDELSDRFLRDIASVSKNKPDV